MHAFLNMVWLQKGELTPEYSAWSNRQVSMLQQPPRAMPRPKKLANDVQAMEWRVKKAPCSIRSQREVACFLASKVD
jgi:hypothetical protein